MKRYYKRHQKALVAVALIYLVTAASVTLMAFLEGALANAAMAGAYHLIPLLTLGTLLYIGVDTALDFFYRYVREAAILSMIRDLRHDLVDKIARLPWEDKRRHDDGWYASLVVNDTQTIEEEYLGSLASMLFSIFLLIMSVGAALFIHPLLTVLMVGVSALSAVIPKLTKKPLQKAKEAAQTAKSDHLSAANQLFGGFFLLKIFDSMGGMEEKYDGANEALCRKEKKFRRTRGLLYSGSYGCGSIIYLGTWALGALLILRGQLTLPMLIVLTNLMSATAGPMENISAQYASTVAAAAVKKRLMDFLDAPTDETNRWGSAPLDAVDAVELSHLTYAVDGKELLKGVDLKLRKGDRVALLGESGSGKSTLLKVLAAMQTGEGGYTLNGKPCRDYAYADFRKQVTLLEQKSFVFDASIRDNVTLFDPQGGDRDDLVRSLLQKVGLGKWLESRGGDLSAPIGKDQQALSGGEERRLDLARTLYRGASLVLLDEPTTGLDPETRSAVEETISALPCDILVVSVHDCSPEFLAQFDRVLTVRNGTVTETPL